MDFTKTFFAQSYQNSMIDYMYSCENIDNDQWDYIILTAANARQAEAYELQITRRREEGRLPIKTQFVVIPDYKDERVGSGGATFGVLKYIVEKDGVESLSKKKILVIHSGGDSKRIPQYSACGKLFAPVARELPNGYVSTIFDELIIAATDIPTRIGAGMLVLPSDTELLFNSLQLDLLSCEAAGLSMKAPVLEGQEHGVFLASTNKSDRRNYDVEKFLHKLSESVLRKVGAVDASDNVDIDTGCIWLGKKVLRSLANLILTDDQIDMDKFESFVNPRICLNFYSEFVYPLSVGGNLEEYLQQNPENGFSKELEEARLVIWNSLHEYNMSLVRLVPAQYIHFGMTHEMYDLWVKHIKQYDYLNWERRVLTNATRGTVLNSVVSSETQISDNAYMENCILTGHSMVGEGSIVSGIEAQDVEIPKNVVLSMLKQKDGKFVCRIYGKEDNPKSSLNAPFLGSTIAQLIQNVGIDKKEVWSGGIASIWNAAIYPICDAEQDAIAMALILCKILRGTASKEEKESYVAAIKTSLKDSFLGADVAYLISRQQYIRKSLFINNFIEDIKSGRSMLKCLDTLYDLALSAEELLQHLNKVKEKSHFPVNMRLALACAHVCRHYGMNSPHNYNYYEDQAYEIVKQEIVSATREKHQVADDIRPILHGVHIELPVRVNFCGSPSDAAPYCLEHGGTMIDGAVLLKGELPIKVDAAIKDGSGYELISVDQGTKAHFQKDSDILDCGNPFDPFALHKAVLVACQVIGKFEGCLSLSTNVNVPKGSGLGTSSIIAAAAVKAVNTMFGQDISEQTIYALVFLVEQLMNTGGGWQDQVGGLTAGIKYFTAMPGKYQQINVEHLRLSQSVKEELDCRFALIFSGQRRLARNVLREELNQCIRCDEDALKAIETIQEYCAIMRQHLLKGDVTAFARYITKQFELVKTLDQGASNACIEYIFDVCEDLICGKSICGAGGGGFLMVVLKEGVTKDMLCSRIEEVFVDCGVEVWDSSLFWED